MTVNRFILFIMNMQLLCCQYYIHQYDLFTLAKAVPAHVHIPLYEQLQEEQRLRR